MSSSARRPYREFGSWLRSRRLARRWTQEELARRLHYDVSYVRKVEWGERRPSDAFRSRLAEVLGVPVSGLPGDVPPASPRRLPEAANPLVDRVDELAAILDLFDSGTRLVTLLGGPGIGKTRLALALACHYDDRLPGGARFVPLLDVVDAAGVSDAIAEAVGVTGPEGEDRLEPLADGLRAQETLLVLDNFEQALDGAPVVADLLGRVRSLRVLVTSREALDLSAETQFPLPPLALPDHPGEPPEQLADVAAVALFVARARKVRPSFALGPTNAADVAEICLRVQGIPLAIEMAAGAMKYLAPKALLDQLGHGLDLPVAGPRDAPEHHRTLRAAIGWSFVLLGPHEKSLMSRLSVFTGGCTLEAAEAVCRLPDEHGLDPRTGLLALASKSLLQPVLDSAGGARFMTLETVRAFASEQLAAAGELERFQGRHAAWCLTLAQANEQRLTGADQTAALAALEADHANLRTAIRWSLDHDPVTATRLCAALWRFWWIRGYVGEGRKWLAEALARPQEDACAHAMALTGAGVLARTQGAYGEATELLDRAADLSRSIGDRRTLALSLINQGIVAEHQGVPEKARPLFEESRQLYQTLEDRRGVGHTLNCLATSSLGQGDLEGSSSLFEEALSIFREVDDDWSAAMALANLGWVAQQQGRSAVARARYSKGLGVYRGLGDDQAVANTLLNLGLAIHGAGEPEEVTGLFAEALLGFARPGERRGMAECVEALALVARADDPTRATVLLGAATALRDSIGAPLPAGDRAVQDGVVAGLRAELGEASFDVAWQRGRLLEVDDIVAVALAETERAGPRQ